MRGFMAHVDEPKKAPGTWFDMKTDCGFFLCPPLQRYIYQPRVLSRTITPNSSSAMMSDHMDIRQRSAG